MLIVHENFREPTGPKLYVCSTPIGNLQDASQRLIDTLRSVDVVAAEDTRHTRKLLAHFDIHPPLLVSYHEHNERSRVRDLERWWTEGKTVALVSDAGTPLVSDPGRTAVELALQRGVPVVPIPGPSALLAALVASGLPALPFTFYGFLPRDGAALDAVIDSWPRLPGTVIFYEAPHRLRRTLERVARRLPGCRVAVAKELTKRHETLIRGKVEEVVGFLQDHEIRGEYVVVVDPAGACARGTAVEPFRGTVSAACTVSVDSPGLADSYAASMAESMESDDAFAVAVELVRKEMAQGMSHAEAVRRVAAQTGVRRRTLYEATIPRHDPAAEDVEE